MLSQEPGCGYCTYTPKKRKHELLIFTVLTHANNISVSLLSRGAYTRKTHSDRIHTHTHSRKLWRLESALSTWKALAVNPHYCYVWQWSVLGRNYTTTQANPSKSAFFLFFPLCNTKMHTNTQTQCISIQITHTHTHTDLSFLVCVCVNMQTSCSVSLTLGGSEFSTASLLCVLKADM